MIKLLECMRICAWLAESHTVYIFHIMQGIKAVAGRFLFSRSKQLCELSTSSKTGRSGRPPRDSDMF